MRLLSLILIAVASFGAGASELNDCIVDKIRDGYVGMDYKTLETACVTELYPEYESGLISKRRKAEMELKNNDYSFSAHRLNYFLPAYSSSGLNRSIYGEKYAKSMENVEAKFQLSFKMSLTDDPLFFQNDGLYVAFTMKGLWQIHSDDISKPFRTVDYRPEIFYFAPAKIDLFDGNMLVGIGLEHESNGETGALSRSWNRLYSLVSYERENTIMLLQPYFRIPEKSKSNPEDDLGDDNPDILDYLGNYELKLGYQLCDDSEFIVGARSNLITGRGSIEMGYTFPIWGKFNGYITAFHGYGDSLIDYNHEQTRIGLGVTLNDMF